MPAGNLALYTIEATEVLFLDRYRVELPDNGRLRVKLHPSFTEACHPGTLSVFSAVCDEPHVIGAAIILDGLQVEGPPRARVSVVVCGIRKGCTQRYQMLSDEQAQKNNDFWETPWK